ncbi:MAG: threonine/serine dehydratase [Pseudomonadota bacterium]
MITRDDINAAADRINGYVRRTPVMSVAGADFNLGFDIDLKLELFQHTGSFKARGAFNSLLQGNIPPAGVVAASGGNHGAAVAYAASQLGIPARIFVPESAGATKIGLTRATGADLEVVPGFYSDAFTASEAYRARTGAVSIHAYDAPATLAGQGTVGREIELQIPDLNVLLVAVGGGGLIGGITSWFADRVKIVAVEPEAAPTLAAALRDGPDTQVDVGGVAANSLGARQIGRLSHQICSENAVQSILVSDDAITAAQKLLWDQARIAAEPGGAAALAALTSGAYQPPPDARVTVLVCGGNLDPSPLCGP